MEDETSPNELWISKEEFNALNKCSSDVRYKYALKRIAAMETLWLISESEDDEYIAYQICDNERFLPIWSSKEYAQAFCVEDFSSCKCTPITLEYFCETIIDFICEKKLLINVFPTQKESFGKIVDLNTFVNDLSVELDDYK